VGDFGQRLIWECFGVRLIGSRGFGRALEFGGLEVDSGEVYCEI